MGLSLSFDGGGAWEIVESDGTNAVVRSSRSSPPGSTLTGTTPAVSRPYRLKVKSCRRVDESELPFVIEGRLVDVTREQKALLPAKPAS
ncbi:MAG TPA: hypothetical protein VHC69_11060 [Polyangiaceae bacterium]|nr:hypothetical protein [Polyangiaceae bacterium]